jgi:phage baseplate assembly protein W
MMPFDPEYGCGLWEKEFSDLLTTNKSDIRANMRNAIGNFEKRLYNISVSFVSMDDNMPHTLGMVVKVTGNYRDEEDEKKFSASYRIG